MISQKNRLPPNKSTKSTTPEEALRISEMRLEAAKFEFKRLDALSNRKKFLKRIDDDPYKLAQMSRRLGTSKHKVEQYEQLILDIKAKIKEMEEKLAAKT
jgi:DNA repair ATPase RecN